MTVFIQDKDLIVTVFIQDKDPNVFPTCYTNNMTARKIVPLL